MGIVGPGAVFASVEEAAVDALAYAHWRGTERGRRGLMRGGAVRLVADGYSYDEPMAANPRRPDRIQYSLSPLDVARFHTYPKRREASVDRSNEQHSPHDRQVVDRVDPLHRPLFILTPSLTVRVYHGEGSDAGIATLRDGAPGPFVALH